MKSMKIMKLAALPAITALVVPMFTAVSAQAASGDLSTVSITVELDMVSETSGPAVFQVTDVPVGAGPELSGADLVSNPSDWNGSLFVDLDNATHTITISPDEKGWDFETARITITSPGLGVITLVSDDLWLDEPFTDDDGVEHITEMVLDYHSSGDTASINWATSTENVSLFMNDEGAAVFEWKVEAPTTTTESTTSTTQATTSTTQAAAPHSVTPRFAG